MTKQLTYSTIKQIHSVVSSSFALHLELSRPYAGNGTVFLVPNTALTFWSLLSTPDSTKPLAASATKSPRWLLAKCGIVPPVGFREACIKMGWPAGPASRWNGRELASKRYHELKIKISKGIATAEDLSRWTPRGRPVGAKTVNYRCKPGPKPRVSVAVNTHVCGCAAGRSHKRKGDKVSISGMGLVAGRVCDTVCGAIKLPPYATKLTKVVEYAAAVCTVCKTEHPLDSDGFCVIKGIDRAHDKGALDCMVAPNTVVCSKAECFSKLIK